MQLTVLCSGPFANPALNALISRHGEGGVDPFNVTCITNSAHDISLAGLRFWPSFDAACSIPFPRGVTDAPSSEGDRAGQLSLAAAHVLRQAGLIPAGRWAWLDDESIGYAVVRAARRARGMDELAVARGQVSDCRVETGTEGDEPAVLPSTPEPIELHVVESDEDGNEASRHALRWIEDPHARTPQRFVVAGVDRADASPGVLEALRTSDVVVLPPMSPVLDAAGFLAVRGVRDALRGTPAHVVALSPVGLRGGRAESVDRASWSLTGGEASSTTLAALYRDFVDVLVIDADEPPADYPSGLRVVRAPLQAALEAQPSAAAELRRIVLG